MEPNCSRYVHLQGPQETGWINLDGAVPDTVNEPKDSVQEPNTGWTDESNLSTRTSMTLQLPPELTKGTNKAYELNKLYPETNNDKHKTSCTKEIKNMRGRSKQARRKKKLESQENTHTKPQKKQAQAPTNYMPAEGLIVTVYMCQECNEVFSSEVVRALCTCIKAIKTLKKQGATK